ncbi:sugar phosphate isomerase/epimerase [Candidatus Micrarchaeota archaeon]|nr:sugar phosphate isomerase/epimerase [Candidatus Micrarchaeota archaeon]
MRLGFVVWVTENFQDMVDFAKNKNFDFVEITLGDQTSPPIDFPVMGHLMFNHDMTNLTSDVYRELVKLQKLGAEKITIHPTYHDMNIKTLLEKNIDGIIKLNDYCRNEGMELYLENTSNPIISSAENLNKIVEECYLDGITLDIGHLRRNKQEKDFLNPNIIDKIKHFHLHNVVDGIDHATYTKENLAKDLNYLKNFKNADTLSLEFFVKIIQNQTIRLGEDERREEMLKTLEQLKHFYTLS